MHSAVTLEVATRCVNFSSNWENLSNSEGLAKSLFNNRFESSRVNKRMSLAEKTVTSVAAHHASDGSLQQ